MTQTSRNPSAAGLGLTREVEEGGERADGSDEPLLPAASRAALAPGRPAPFPSPMGRYGWVAPFLIPIDYASRGL